MDNLPYEIIVYILIYLKVDDIISFALTNKKYLSVFEDDNFWSKKAYNLFKFPIQEFQIKSQSAIIRYLNIQYLLRDPYNNFIKCIKLGSLNDVNVLLHYVDPSYNMNEAIRVASQKRQINIVKRLLKDDRVNPFDERIKLDPTEDPQPLIASVIYGYDDLLEILLNTANGNPDYMRNYLMELSCRYGHLHIVNMLLKYPQVNPATDRNYCLDIACEKGNIDIVKLLLSDVRVDPSDANNNPIVIASKYGHLDIVKLLLSDVRVNPSDQDNRAMTEACDIGNINIVKELLKDHRVNPSTTNNYAFIKACSHGHIEIVKLLLSDPRVDPSDNNNVSLKTACSNGQVDVIALLLKDPRIDPNHKKSKSRNTTPLHYATLNDRLEVIKILLQDPRVNPNNSSSIKFLLRKGSYDIVESILISGRLDPTILTEKEINCYLNDHMNNLLKNFID